MNAIVESIVKQGADLLMHGKVVRLSILAILGVLIYAYSWANETFVKQTDFARLVASVDIHMKKMDIMAAGNLSRDKQIQLQIAQATGAELEVIAKLEREVAAAVQYEHCLIEERPNCEFLQPKF